MAPPTWETSCDGAQVPSRSEACTPRQARHAPRAARRARWAALRRGARHLRHFVSARLVTTAGVLVAATVLAGLAWP